MEALDRAGAALREAASDVEGARASVLEVPSDDHVPSVTEILDRYHVPEAALMAFVQTVSEILGERPISVESARRAAVLAVAGQAWENDLGPLLASSQVRELLGNVSRQRVDELLRAHRLIGLLDSSGRRRFPLFQFGERGPLESLIAAFWIVASGAVSEWSAASWCTAPDDALGGLTPVLWAREDRDAGRLMSVARQDAARLAR